MDAAWTAFSDTGSSGATGLDVRWSNGRCLGLFLFSSLLYDCRLPLVFVFSPSTPSIVLSSSVYLSLCFSERLSARDGLPIAEPEGGGGGGPARQPTALLKADNRLVLVSY